MGATKAPGGVLAAQPLAGQAWRRVHGAQRPFPVVRCGLTAERWRQQQQQLLQHRGNAVWTIVWRLAPPERARCCSLYKWTVGERLVGTGVGHLMQPRAAIRLHSRAAWWHTLGAAAGGGHVPAGVELVFGRVAAL
jgi:hypothetical protein